MQTQIEEQGDVLAMEAYLNKQVPCDDCGRFFDHENLKDGSYKPCHDKYKPKDYVCNTSQE